MTESAPTYVLLPGAGGNARYWYLVTERLRERGHEVIPVELPAGDCAAGSPEYADAAVRAIGDRTGIILVAQSLAGFTAPLVCQRVQVSLLVLLNAMIPLPGETPGEWWEATGQSQARRENDVREGRPADADFDLVTYFFHDVPQSVRDEVMKVDVPQSDTVFSSVLTIEKWPDVPTRVLVGRDDRLFPLDFQQRVARERLGIEPDVIPGGHLVAFSEPAALVEQLERYRVAAGLG